ncbi:hypothetical protein [Pseudoxanthomonas sp. JBR18]|uniref:hypothetical protein n=1 Tax=Pseudoxanthomonas sp. JBR18 TaxID=2969308 RepID=UPI0023054A84|nr:hypothetical protein [Pseudoxanthomonas sp. JBR18]WCE04452.1 hypothetical protein PJ250_00110 [Pseudoxanthomonas sp. JBR18]
MTWTRTSTDTMSCPPWLIAKGWFIDGPCYRLFRAARLVAVCPSAEAAMAFTKRGIA